MKTQMLPKKLKNLMILLKGIFYIYLAITLTHIYPKAYHVTSIPETYHVTWFKDEGNDKFTWVEDEGNDKFTWVEDEGNDEFTWLEDEKVCHRTTELKLTGVWETTYRYALALLAVSGLDRLHLCQMKFDQQLELWITFWNMAETLK